MSYLPGDARPSSAAFAAGGLPLVSIVVPTRNSEMYLSACLRSVREQDYSNIELLVVDRDSTDSTLQIARAFDTTILSAGPERSAQVNAGVRSSRGQFILRVDADFALEPAVVSECVSLAAAGADAVVVHNTSVEVGWLSRIRKFEVDMYKYSLDHSAARFVSKEVFDAIGGYAEDMTAGEDYDFQNRIIRSNFRTAFCDAEAIHLDEPIRLSTVLRKYFCYGRDFPHYRRQNVERSRTQLAFLRKDYIRHWRRFVRHPLLALGLLVYHCLKYLSGGLGYLSAVVRPPGPTGAVAASSDDSGCQGDT